MSTFSGRSFDHLQAFYLAESQYFERYENKLSTLR